jgi:hypothetical protein
MISMSQADWMEVALIALLTAGSWLLQPLLPAQTSIAQAVLMLSALLLAQSLIRDCLILWRKRHTKNTEPTREMQCFCLESTLGMTGVVLGLALFGLAGTRQLSVSAPGLALAAGATLTLGFLIKDLVLTWNPFGVKREKDHLNLVVRWRR